MHVLIVGDARLARSELRTLLAPIRWVDCAGQAVDVPAAREAILLEQPDLVLPSLRTPSGEGFDVIEGLATAEMVVSVTAYEQYAVRALEPTAAVTGGPRDQLGEDDQVFPCDCERSSFVALVEIRRSSATTHGCGFGTRAPFWRAVEGTPHALPCA